MEIEDYKIVINLLEEKVVNRMCCGDKEMHGHHAEHIGPRLSSRGHGSWNVRLWL